MSLFMKTTRFNFKIDAKSPKELNSILNKFDYGFMYNGKRYDDIDPDKYRTIDPESFEKYRIGACWDYTAYEYYYFLNKFPDLHPETYFILAVLNGTGTTPTHTWLSYSNDDKFYIFESSWKYQGITEYSSKDNLFKSYSKLWLEDSDNETSHYPIKEFYILKFVPPTKFNMTPDEYMRYVDDTGIEVLGHKF